MSDPPWLIVMIAAESWQHFPESSLNSFYSIETNECQQWQRLLHIVCCLVLIFVSCCSLNSAIRLENYQKAWIFLLRLIFVKFWCQVTYTTLKNSAFHLAILCRSFTADLICEFEIKEKSLFWFRIYMPSCKNAAFWSLHLWFLCIAVTRHKTHACLHKQFVDAN